MSKLNATSTALMSNEMLADLAAVVHSLVVVIGMLIGIIVLIIVAELITLLRWVMQNVGGSKGRLRRKNGRSKRSKSSKSRSKKRSRYKKRRSKSKSSSHSSKSFSNKVLKKSMSGVQCGEHKPKGLESMSSASRPTTRSVETFGERSMKEHTGKGDVAAITVSDMPKKSESAISSASTTAISYTPAPTVDSISGPSVSGTITAISTTPPPTAVAAPPNASGLSSSTVTSTTPSAPPTTPVDPSNAIGSTASTNLPDPIAPPRISHDVIREVLKDRQSVIGEAKPVCDSPMENIKPVVAEAKLSTSKKRTILSDKLK